MEGPAASAAVQEQRRKRGGMGWPRTQPAGHAVLPHTELPTPLWRELVSLAMLLLLAALFQCLPVSARVMSDALSEATFLLFIATALSLAVRALRGQSAARFAWCGFFSGLAYLTRPEGALLVVATGLVLLAMQCSPSQ